jgi:hypothetical protein
MKYLSSNQSLNAKKGMYPTLYFLVRSTVLTVPFVNQLIFDFGIRIPMYIFTRGVGIIWERSYRRSKKTEEIPILLLTINRDPDFPEFETIEMY